MSVLHVHSGNLYGGVESMLTAMARLDATQKFALCFDGRLGEELRSAGCEVISLGSVRVRQPFSILRARRRLAEAIAKVRPTAVLCHSAWSQALFGGVVKAAGAAVVFWQHDIISGKHWLQRAARRVRPDLAISNSRHCAKTLPALYPDTRVEVVYCPVAPRVADPEWSREQIRRECSTASGAVVLFQASRLEEWKGHTLLFDALTRLRTLPGWVMWLAGGAQRPHEAAYLARLQAQVEQAGIADRVRFLGQRSDVPRLLHASDVFCQPNTAPEPFGVAMIEALQASVPVVATAMGGPVEVLDESCGVLAAPGDADALAAALKRLIVDPAERARLSANGPERARELCDPRNQMQKLLEAVESIA
ncbi:MAG: glycosyltransferase [Bryobacteraceae bacterium]